MFSLSVVYFSRLLNQYFITNAHVLFKKLKFRLSAVFFIICHVYRRFSAMLLWVGTQYSYISFHFVYIRRRIKSDERMQRYSLCSNIRKGITFTARRDYQKVKYLESDVINCLREEFQIGTRSEIRQERQSFSSTMASLKCTTRTRRDTIVMPTLS